MVGFFIAISKNQCNLIFVVFIYSFFFLSTLWFLGEEDPSNLKSGRDVSIADQWLFQPIIKLVCLPILIFRFVYLYLCKIGKTHVTHRMNRKILFKIVFKHSTTKTTTPLKLQLTCNHDYDYKCIRLLMHGQKSWLKRSWPAKCFWPTEKTFSMTESCWPSHRPHFDLVQII